MDICASYTKESNFFNKWFNSSFTFLFKFFFSRFIPEFYLWGFLSYFSAFSFFLFSFFIFFSLLLVFEISFCGLFFNLPMSIFPIRSSISFPFRSRGSEEVKAKIREKRWDKWRKRMVLMDWSILRWIR